METAPYPLFARARTSPSLVSVPLPASFIGTSMNSMRAHMPSPQLE